MSLLERKMNNSLTEKEYSPEWLLEEFVKILKVLGFKKKQISLFFAKDVHNKER